MVGNHAPQDQMHMAEINVIFNFHIYHCEMPVIKGILILFIPLTFRSETHR